VAKSTKIEQERVIMGIDPGTTIMGYGVVRVKGSKLEMLDLGILNMTKSKNHAQKLKKIFEGTLELIDKHHPDELAIEAPFFGKNVQSMLKLGRAQGVAIAAAVYRDLPMVEYSPRKIKQSITGSGASSKEQVAAMLESILKIKNIPKQLDATDGLAAAVCHYFNTSKTTGVASKSYSGWGAYVKANPKKTKE
jgi:crossover junction endodeoxyribonuclease RuvC